MKNLFRTFLKSRLQVAQVSRRRTARRVRPAAEWLEDRTLPAGNVLAVVTNGSLILTGDSADNSVAVSISSGNIVVQGSAGTTINGQTSQFVAATGTVRLAHDFRASMGAGNDTLSVTGVTFLDNVIVDGGAGDDTVNLTSVTSGDNITVDGGAGNDVIRFRTVSMDDNLRITGGSGDDTISFDLGYVDDDATIQGGDGNDSIAIARVYINDSATIDGGNGDDTILMRNNRTDDDTHVDGGDGNDRIEITSSSSKDFMSLTGGAGDDSFVLRSSFARRDFNLDAGTGNDTIDFATTTFHSNAYITTGDGNDILVTDTLTAQKFIQILTGDGDDRVVFQDSSFSGTSHVFTGEGDDFVDVIASAFGGTGLFATESGNDIFNTSGATSFNGVLIADGGSGTDSVNVDAATQTRGGRAIGAMESLSVNPATINSLLNDPTTGALTITSGVAAQLASLFPPTTTADSFNAPNGTLTTTSANGVLANDSTSVLGGALTATRVANPSHGTLTLNSNGTFTYTATAGYSGTDSFTYRAVDSFGNQSAVTTVTLVVQDLPLTLDLSSNETQQSNGTLVTEDSTFHVVGTTGAGATVAIDSNGDNVFDNGTATADSSGHFSIDVTLLNNSTNHGANVLQVRSTLSTASTTQTVNVHYAIGTVVRFATSLGSYDVELLDDDAPQTVAAFLANLNRYNDSIVHRSDDGFVIQGGGFTVNPTTGAVGTVTPFTAPPNEFLAANSNVRGTLSTAQIGGNINSFTGQWFVNVSNTNSFLDSVPHTVFGRVIGTGMTVVDQINNLTSFNRTDLNGAFGELPLRNFTSGTPAPANYIYAPIGKLFQ